MMIIAFTIMTLIPFHRNAGLAVKATFSQTWIFQGNLKLLGQLLHTLFVLRLREPSR